MDGVQLRRPRAKKKLWILLPVILLVILSLLFLGTRMRQWVQEKEKTKLLTLVDREHPVEDDYNVEFTLLGEGQMVDSRRTAGRDGELSHLGRAGARV